MEPWQLMQDRRSRLVRASPWAGKRGAGAGRTGSRCSAAPGSPLRSRRRPPSARRPAARTPASRLRPGTVSETVAAPHAVAGCLTGILGCCDLSNRNNEDPDRAHTWQKKPAQQEHKSQPPAHVLSLHRSHVACMWAQRTGQLADEGQVDGHSVAHAHAHRLQPVRLQCMAQRSGLYHANLARLHVHGAILARFSRYTFYVKTAPPFPAS